MSIHEMKIIHVRRLYHVENVSLERGKRVLRDLERKGLIAPQVTPTAREYISPTEAETFHKALHA